ncbi:MAG TPA: mechanosensitive ion channel family protein [Casimicrobiaceae bacterium]|nr:mechanosensitive ion channel family protein [Casimicrobiaceae bacterium]
MKTLLLATALTVAAAVATPASHAQDKAGAGSAAAAAPAAPPATLLVFNRPVVTLRQTVLGVPPSDRASIARDRIYAIIDRGGEGKVAVEEIPQGEVVTVDGRVAFVISREDAAAGAGETPDAMVQDVVAALTRAIAEGREARDSRFMLRAVAYAVAATAIYVAVVWILLVVGRRITLRMLHFAHRTTLKLKVGGGTVVQRHRAVLFTRRLMRLAGWGLLLLITYEWLGYVLGRFPYTRPWSEHLNEFLVDTVVTLLVSIAKAAPELLVAIVIFFIAHTVNRLQRGFFEGVQAGRIRVSWVDKDTAPATRRLLSLAVWLFAAVMAYPYIPGSSSDAFKGLSVLLGLMVSVGASGVVGQAASGLILMYTRTYRVGDYVRIGDAEGTVMKMGLFTTHVRTGLGEDLSIPNATVLGTVTRNFSHAAPGAGFMLESSVTIGYDVPWRQVRAMLMDAARATSEVAPAPEARVLVTKLSDFYVEYTLVCYARPSSAYARADVISALHANIIDAFNEHGVQIMSPHYFGDPAQPKVVARAHWFAPPAEPPGAP